MHTFISPLPSMSCNFPNHKLRRPCSLWPSISLNKWAGIKWQVQREDSNRIGPAAAVDLLLLALRHRRPGRSTPKLLATLGWVPLLAQACCGAACSAALGAATGRLLAWPRSSAASVGRWASACAGPAVSAPEGAGRRHRTSTPPAADGFPLRRWQHGRSRGQQGRH